MEKTKPEISIIIPVHNGQEHLEKCLLSIKNQSFTDYEVLVVNNGSTDNTQKIAESFSESDKRFITIKHNHGGAGETRNIGIDRASGNYLAFVDSDDVVLDKYLENLYRAIKSCNADVAVCGYNLYFRNSDKIIRRYKAENKIYEKEAAIKEIVRDRKMRFYLWNKLWRRSLFSDNGISIPDMYYEDAVVCTMLFCHINKVVTTDYCGYSYIRASSDIYKEVQMTGTRINDYINTIPMMRNYLEETGYYKTAKTPFTRHIFHVFFSVPSLCVQARKSLDNGVLKNSFSGLGKVIKSCNAKPSELEDITNWKAIV